MARTMDALECQLCTSRRYALPATLTREEWGRTVADFGGMCAYCQAVPFKVIEHFVSTRKGGGTTPGNCLPACNRCNVRKGRCKVGVMDTFGAKRIADLTAYLASRSTGQDVGKPPKRWGPYRDHFKPDPDILLRLVKRAWDAAGKPSFKEIGRINGMHPVYVERWLRGARTDISEGIWILEALGYELAIRPLPADEE